MMWIFATKTHGKMMQITFKNNFLCAIKHQPKIQGRRILTPPTKTYNYKGR